MWPFLGVFFPLFSAFGRTLNDDSLAATLPKRTGAISHGKYEIDFTTLVEHDHI